MSHKETEEIVSPTCLVCGLLTCECFSLYCKQDGSVVPLKCSSNTECPWAMCCGQCQTCCSMTGSKTRVTVGNYCVSFEY